MVGKVKVQFRISGSIKIYLGEMGMGMGIATT